MAAPAFSNVGTAVTGSAATANVPAPASVSVGDLLIISLFKQNNAAVTAPSGWTALTPQTPATDTGHYVWWKVATATEQSGTYALSWTGSVVREAIAVHLTGASTTAPIDTGAGAPNSAGRASTGTTTPAVSLTTQGADRLLVFLGGCWTAGAWTPPTGYTERYDASSLITVDTVAQATAGATGSVTASCAGNDYETAFLLAIVPAVNPALLQQQPPNRARLVRASTF